MHSRMLGATPPFIRSLPPSLRHPRTPRRRTPRLTFSNSNTIYLYRLTTASSEIEEDDDTNGYDQEANEE